MQRPTLLPIDHWSLPDRGYEWMRVTSPYGDRSGGFHGAIDIGNARLGDVLVAADSGRVHAVGFLSFPWSEPKPTDEQWATWNRVPPVGRYPRSRRPSLWHGSTWGGLMIVIRTARYWLLYAHCQTVSVKAGQTVSAGQRIGTVGESGSAYQAGHVHFGVVNATDAQLAALRAKRFPIPRSMTVDPWPLIASSASSSELPDTSVEDDVYEWVPDITHQQPKIAVVKAGAIPLKNPDGTEHSKGYAFPGGDRIEVIGGLPGWLWVARREDGGGLFLVRNDDIAEWIKVPDNDADLAAARAEGVKAGFIDAKTKAVVAVQGLRP